MSDLSVHVMFRLDFKIPVLRCSDTANKHLSSSYDITSVIGIRYKVLFLCPLLCVSGSRTSCSTSEMITCDALYMSLLNSAFYPHSLRHRDITCVSERLTSAALARRVTLFSLRQTRGTRPCVSICPKNQTTDINRKAW